MNKILRNTLLLLGFAVVVSACQAHSGEEAREAAHQSAIGEACGGIAALQCVEGAYCKLPMGQCDMPDAGGTCTEARQICTREYRPVCGCDGKTYGNACTAGAAGQSIRHLGSCSDQGKGGGYRIK